MQSLTKENFFNAVAEQCPDAMTHFCQWIDEYKKEVNWDQLFAPGIKFHDIPFEMQNGIIARFELELFNNTGGQGKLQYEGIANGYKVQLSKLFFELQHRINTRQEKLN